MDSLDNTVSHWPRSAQRGFEKMRALIQDAACTAQTGPLTESLKWGQPAWRPAKAGIGCTLRVNWSETHPDVLTVYVDCKTDLAARMQTLYPDIMNDGRRALTLPIDAPLPHIALSHLAAMTFTYHRAKALAS